MHDRTGETKIRTVAEHTPGLKLLLLYGSRGRGDAREDSDWDLGYLSGPGFDPDALYVALSNALGVDNIDLADLARANGLLRYRAVSEGRVLHDPDDAFPGFWFEVVTFWWDVEPILNAEYRAVLERLDR